MTELTCAQTDTGSRRSMINASSSSHDEIIGKRFLFELLFSAGDVGEFILTFLPGKKGKEWSHSNKAAAAGHLHIVTWLWKKGIRTDRSGANAAAAGGFLH
jgi:hypothetical protein